MLRADHETRIRVQKTTKLKQVDNRIITLKREISKLKDILAEYGTYQGFLSDLSPQTFREKQKQAQEVHSIFTLHLDYIVLNQSTMIK